MSDHQVTSKAVVIATGVTEPTGAGRSWASTSATRRTRPSGGSSCAALKRRGLEGVRLVISDQHAGLVAAIGRCFQGAAHQRCRVHFARNLLATIPKGHQEMVAGRLPDRLRPGEPGRDRRPVGPGGRPCWPSTIDKAARLMDGAKEEVLAFSAFPRAHWRQIWSTNPLSVNRSREAWLAGAA